MPKEGSPAEGGGHLVVATVLMCVCLAGMVVVTVGDAFTSGHWNGIGMLAIFVVPCGIPFIHDWWLKAAVRRTLPKLPKARLRRG